MIFRTKDDIKKYVEIPLVSACEDFYDKNIQTLASSCNVKDIAEKKAYIILNYGGMSIENKLVADHISVPIRYDELKTVKIEIPITEESTVDQISNTAIEIASKFKKQPATWISTYTFDEMKAIFGIAKDDSQYKPEDFVSPENYWDDTTKLYYPSEELYRKVIENSC